MNNQRNARNYAFQFRTQKELFKNDLNTKPRRTYKMNIKHEHEAIKQTEFFALKI